jgi:hypothetical protein
MAEVQRPLPGDNDTVQPWLYPPVAFFLVLPLSMLPFAPSLVAWVVATGALALSAVRRIAIERGQALVLAFAFPATFANILVGQNGLLTAGLLAWGLMLLKDRPVLAGATLGLLAYKPQFFPLILIALFASGQKRAAISCAGTVIALSATSLILFGPGSWSGFLTQGDSLGEALFSGEVTLSKVQSVAASLLLMDVTPALAKLGQLVTSLGCAALVIWLWRKDTSFEYRAAGLALAILLASPHSYHYDLTLLGLAALWLGVRFQVDGWWRWDAEALLLAWFAPLTYAVVGFAVAPLVIPAVMAVLVRRVQAADGKHDPVPQLSAA